MSEQNTNAQLEAYRKLVDDFKRFVSSEIRAEENSYRIVDMTSEDAEIDDPSVPVTQLEDEKAEKLAGICMDLSNATLWLYYNRDKFANVEFIRKHKKMLPTSTNTRCTLCGCTTRRSIFWKKARLSLTETRNARNCWRFATASTCVKTGRTHPNSLSLLMHSKRDFSMM